jgi:signal transduction histidine kinase
MLCLLLTGVPAWAQEPFSGAEPLGVWQQSQQMQRDYIELLKQKAAAAPHDLALQLNLGRAWHWLALSSDELAVIEGEKVFRQILARDPDNAVALAYVGSMLGLKIGFHLIPENQIGEVATHATAALDRAVQLAPDAIEVRITRGYVSLHTPSVAGRDAFAIEDFTHLLKLFSQTHSNNARRAEMQLALGDAYRKTGQLAQARAQWEQARTLAPGSSLASAAEARLLQFAKREAVAALTAIRLTALVGFLLGVLLFGALLVLIARDWWQRRKRGTLESFVVRLLAFGWNALNLVVALNALHSYWLAGWQRESFTLLLALLPIPLGLVIVYRFYEAQRKREAAEAELRRLVTQAELKALRAQIDPHFFFNALNSVAALTRRDPAAAEALIEDLADLFRHSFKPSRDFIALDEELHLVETYLNVEKVRLGDKLQFRKTIAPETLTAKIPALTIQPLIENAIKHGIGALPEGGCITLSATVNDGWLNIAVTDTGAGIAPSRLPQLFTCGVGLHNIRERLTALYHEQARLTVDSLPGQGATVSFAIPLQLL